MSMTLKDTVDQMVSDDYRERFEAEVNQLEIRIKKLSTMIDKYRAGKLEFTPACPVELLDKQLKAMYEYMRWLRTRAEIEGIEV